MTSNDKRANQLNAWLNGHLQQPFSISLASQDASTRSYYRITQNGQTKIAMDMVLDKDSFLPYKKIAELLNSIGINVPKIYQYDLDAGFALISDLGSRQYLTELNTQSVENLFQDAFDALFNMQTKASIKNLPPYDKLFLKKELNIFNEWLLNKHSNIQLNTHQKHIIDSTYNLLIESALEQPILFMHRDFHSRNLMKVDQNNPGVLDFQGALAGPVTYDLVSLLRDCYIKWPEKTITQWLQAYYFRLKKDQIITCKQEQFERWFDLMGMQRHIKAIGIFIRLNILDNKARYLNDIPRTFSYIEEVCEKYHELKSFLQLIKSLPIMKHTD